MVITMNHLNCTACTTWKRDILRGRYACVTAHCSMQRWGDKLPTVKQFSDRKAANSVKIAENMWKLKIFCPLFWSFWKSGIGQMSAIIGRIYSISGWSAAKCPLYWICPLFLESAKLEFHCIRRVSFRRHLVRSISTLVKSTYIQKSKSR